MVSKVTKVVNSQGFHMRPATMFVGEMGKFESDVNLVCEGKTVNAKSLMNIIAACIKCGSEVKITCDGEDESAMLQKAVEMIESGLGE